MKPLALLIALGALAGCGRHPRHYPVAGEGVVPKPEASTVAAKPESAVTRPTHVIVDPPPPPPPWDDQLPKSGNVSALDLSLTDAYFPYDRAEPLPESLTALEQDARLLRTMLNQSPGALIVVEGHCDDRGSAEYNIGLGDRRARTAVRVLRENGVPAANLEVVSFGREQPQCTELTEACRQRNRRAHLTVRPAPSPGTDEVPAGETPPPARNPLP